MNRRVLAVIALVAVMGGVALAQCSCVTPQPTGPKCYAAFWVGQAVEIELKAPVSFCCCCCDSPEVLGWHVEAWGGGVVYSATLSAPQAARQFSAVWDQTDQQGNQVAAGFYQAVVTTTDGDYVAPLKIVARPQGGCCCWWPFGYLRSISCARKWCEPYVVLSRACTAPCCGVQFRLGCCP
ncbi:MAG: hypothetical protein ACP5G2_04095 [Candidatus Bipolaricaulaceae bacterium]